MYKMNVIEMKMLRWIYDKITNKNITRYKYLKVFRDNVYI